MDYHLVLDACIALAKDAGKLVMEIYGREFDISTKSEGKCFIFQVRPLVLRVETSAPDKTRQILRQISEKIQAAQGEKPYLYGKRAIYGVMPDWNPAEMIGTHPRPLALSLYKEIITDSVWAYQRNNYGYQNLRSFPLLIDFCGLPYIDVKSEL